MRKVNLVGVSDAKERVAQHAPCVPMPEPVLIPCSFSKMGPPNNLWTYRMPNGDPYAAVARWDTADGKQVRPIIWNGTDFVTSGFGSSRSSSKAFTSPTKVMSAPCSAAVHSKNVGTTRRVITSTCPGDTGYESKIANAR